MTTSILLVDDNGIQGMSRKAILDRRFPGVAIADSPTRALSLVEDQEFLDSLRLVITDHLMPLMNGPELVRALRELRPDLPILVLSGLPDAKSEYDDLDVVFRTKPFPPDQLIALAAEMTEDAETSDLSRSA